MRIQAITLQGYKSFASRYTFVFPSGITAIIGPNGSGKSNVADAIRWVLGEQRQSAMRARRAEDMIFAGTEGRSKAGLAQVTVAFDNSDHWLDLDYAEVEVSRRAHRDGSLQALINGAAVRLRDVQDLLSGRLGQGNYTVIGQGQVDAALSLRPEERRGLIDEAAGLVPLQRRRERCLRQLAETHDNLTRVRDLTEDLGPRLQRMSRLARRAEQHQAISTELRGLLETWYGHHWHRVQRELAEANRAVDTLRRTLEERRRAVEQSLARHEAARVAGREAEAALQAARSALEQRLRADALLRERAALAAARIEGLQQRREELAQDLAQVAAQREALAARQAAQRESLDRLAQDDAAWAERAAQTRAALTAAQERRAQEDRRRQEGQRAILEAGAGRAAQEGRVRLATAELEALDRRREELAAQALPLQARVQETGAARDALAAAAAEAAAAGALATAALAAADEALAAAQAAAAEAQAAEREGAESLRSLQRRAQALDGLIGQLDAGGPGLDRLRQAAGIGLLGQVGDLLEVEDRWEAAVAALLGPRLHAFVLDGAQALAAARQLLGEGLPGQLTLIDGRAPAPQRASLPDGGLRCDAAPALIDQLFWQARLYPGDAEARKAAQDQPELLCAGPDGTVYQGLGQVTIGPPARDLLALRRERRSLPALQQAAEAQAQEAHRRAEAALAALSEARAEGQRRGTELRAAQVRQREAEAAFVRGRDEADKAGRDLAWAQEAAERLAGEREACAGRLAEHSAALAEARARESAARAAHLDDEALPQDDAELRSLGLTLSQVEAGRAESAQALATAQGSAAALTHELNALNGRAATLEARDLSLSQAIEAAAAEAAQLAGLASPEAEVQDVESDLLARQEALDLARRSAAEAEADLDRQRAAAEAGERQLTELRLAATRVEDRFERLYDQLRGEADTLGLDLGDAQLSLDARSQVRLPEVPAIEPDLEQRVDQLRGRLRSLGPIDQEALSTYEESQAHYDELMTQEADLRAADADLRQLLTRLDQDISAGFAGTFAQVAEAFSRYFPLLFGGGEAELLLTRVTDTGGAAPAEPGLDIMARPPGKRRQPLGLLSGGERALTAVALTFALLEVSGTPFVVLDEVDAALDEANVDRFCQALRTLAEGRQVVVITHNRGTIQTASTVYGVSMADDGASQVISLRVDQLPEA